MNRLFALGLCLLASCYLEVESSGRASTRDESRDEREASSAFEPSDAAVWNGARASEQEAGARAPASGAFALADAGAEGGVPAAHVDAAVTAAPAASTAFALSSPAFTDGARLPEPHTCEGGDESPPFVWTNPPDGVETFMLVLTATRAAWPRPTVEWVIWNIPGESLALSEGLAAGREPNNAEGLRQEALSEVERAALDLGVTGIIAPPRVPGALAPVDLPSPLDLVRRPRYRGPCDEQGVSYEFTLFALDAAASREREHFLSLEAVEQWMKQASGALGRASIVATYP